jgi:hypothetical protein
MLIPSKIGDIKPASPNLLQCAAGRGWVFQSRPRYIEHQRPLRRSGRSSFGRLSSSRVGVV